LGREGNESYSTDCSRKIRRIELDAIETDSYGKFRSLYFTDDQDETSDGIAFYNPFFQQPLGMREIPDGFELIGVSLTMQDGKFWPNFLLWPTD
jgi:hypothetical protein